MTKPTGERLKHQLASAVSTEAGLFVMQFFFNIATTRALMPEGKGVFSSTTGLIGICTTLASFGVSKATIQVANRPGVNPRDVYAAVWWMTLPMCLAVTAAVLVFSPADLPPGAQVAAVGMACAFMVSGNLEGLLRSRQRTMAINASALLQLAVTLAGVGLHLWRSKDPLSVVNVLDVVLAGWVARLVVLAAAYARADAWPSTTRLAALPWRDLVAYGAAYQVYAITWTLHMRQDITLAPYLTTAAEVGLYATAGGLAQMLWKVPTAVGSVVLPRLVEDGGKRSAGLTAAATRWSLLVVIFPALGMGLLAPWVLGLLYGPEFEAAALPMRVLLPGTVSGTVYLVAASNLVAKGQLRPLITIGVACASANALLNVILQPLYGGTGAALTSCITYTASAVAVLWVVIRDSGLPVSDFLLVKPAEIQRLLRRGR